MRVSKDLRAWRQTKEEREHSEKEERRIRKRILNQRRDRVAHSIGHQWAGIRVDKHLGLLIAEFLGYDPVVFFWSDTFQLVHPVNTSGGSLFWPGDLVRNAQTMEWAFYLGRPLTLSQSNLDQGIFFVNGSVGKRAQLITGNQNAWQMVHRAVIDVWRHSWCEDAESPMDSFQGLMNKCLGHLNRAPEGGPSRVPRPRPPHPSLKQP